MKTIGIIGGMGPQASILLHEMIVNQAVKSGATECDEFPLINHISLPVKDFISDPSNRIGNLPLLDTARKTIKALQPDAVVIACNTAHLLLEDEPLLGTLPLISLPESVMDAAKAKGIDKLGLMASPTTLGSKLYDSPAESAGIELVKPTKKQAKQLEEVIRRTIAGVNDKRDEVTPLTIAKDLQRRGAEAVVLGCTELSVIMREHEAEDMIDALECAALRLDPIKEKK